VTHGSETRIRNKHLTIRFSGEQRSAIEGDAERAGLSTGSYARQVLLGADPPRQVRRPIVERRELARLLGALGQVGNNVNQLARASNQGAEVDRTALLGALSDLRAVRDAVLVALGRDP
jgi:hypothetical protein